MFRTWWRAWVCVVSGMGCTKKPNISVSFRSEFPKKQSFNYWNRPVGPVRTGTDFGKYADLLVFLCTPFILEGFVVGFLVITLFWLQTTQRCKITENCASPAPDAFMKRGQECPSATTIASVSPAMLEKSSARYRHTIWNYQANGSYSLGHWIWSLIIFLPLSRSFCVLSLY